VENKMMHHAFEKDLSEESTYFDGSLMRATVTFEDFVVSCADCTNATVQWFDHDLDLTFRRYM